MLSNSSSAKNSLSVSSSTIAPEQTAMIEKILQDPLLLRQLCDRVYQLMLEDARLQRDRLMRF